MPHPRGSNKHVNSGISKRRIAPSIKRAGEADVEVVYNLLSEGRVVVMGVWAESVEGVKGQHEPTHLLE